MSNTATMPKTRCRHSRTIFVANLYRDGDDWGVQLGTKDAPEYRADLGDADAHLLSDGDRVRVRVIEGVAHVLGFADE